MRFITGLAITLVLTIISANYSLYPFSYMAAPIAAYALGYVLK